MDRQFRMTNVPVAAAFCYHNRSLKLVCMLLVAHSSFGCHTTRYFANRLEAGRQQIEHKLTAKGLPEQSSRIGSEPKISFFDRRLKNEAGEQAFTGNSEPALEDSLPTKDQVDPSNSTEHHSGFQLASATSIAPANRLEGNIGNYQPTFVVQETSPLQTQQQSSQEPVEGSFEASQTKALEAGALGRSVEHYVAEALARSAKLAAARHRVSAAANVIPQVSALPDPVFANNFWPLQEQALQTAGGRVGNQMSLTQRVPFPDKLRAQAAVASREVQIAKAEAEVIEREITEAVRLSCFEVWYASRAIKVLEESRSLLADLTRVAQSRMATGGSQRDVIRVELEEDRLDERLIELESQKRVAQADLAALLRQPEDLSPEVSFDANSNDARQQIDTLIALAEECNPILRGLGWQVQRDREREHLACLQQYPDFNMGLNWGLITDDNAISPVADGNDNLSFTFGTTLPIWRQKIEAGIREAAHRRSSSTRKLNAERDEIRGQIRRIIAQIDALDQQKQLYQQRIVPRTEKAMTLSMTDYVGGRLEFAELIALYRELLEFETKIARLDATIAGRLASLERLVGCTICQ